MLKVGAQRLAEVGHGIEVCGAEMMDPLHHLTGTERLFAQLRKKSLQSCKVEAQKIDFACAEFA